MKHPNRLQQYPEQLRHLGLACLDKHKYFLPAYKFFNAGVDNREIQAMAAYKGDAPWGHSFPLSSACTYLRHVKELNPSVLAQLT